MDLQGVNICEREICLKAFSKYEYNPHMNKET